MHRLQAVVQPAEWCAPPAPPCPTHHAKGEYVGSRGVRLSSQHLGRLRKGSGGPLCANHVCQVHLQVSRHGAGCYVGPAGPVSRAALVLHESMPPFPAAGTAGAAHQPARVERRHGGQAGVAFFNQA